MNISSNIDLLYTKFKNLSGAYSGISKDSILYSPANSNGLGIHIVLIDLPNHLWLDNDNMLASKPVYHISGYGNSFQDAFIRAIGESVERYSAVTHYLRIEQSLISCTAENSSYTILPLKFINILSKEQRAVLKEVIPNVLENELQPNDTTNWIAAYSLFHPDKEILVPCNIFCISYSKRGYIMPSFSTGSACHKDITNALINSIIECIQIDAFIYSWYSTSKYKKIEFESLPIEFQKKLQQLLGTYKDLYEILLIDFSSATKCDMFVVGTFLIAKDSSKNYPCISFGVQGDTNLEHSIFRATQEALAVFNMALNMKINLGAYDIQNTKFADLDSNVIYFAEKLNFSKNLEYITDKIGEVIFYTELKARENSFEDDKAKLKHLINIVSKMSQYACFQNISPPEVECCNFHVSKVFIPELLQMCLPGFPPREHPRFREGDFNEKFIPHPLP